jgi:hypothetical protein
MSVASTLAARVASVPLALRLGDPAHGDLTFLREVTGGTVVGQVTSHTSGNEHFARKQLDGTRNDDFRVQFGTAMSSGLVDWISASWGPKPPKRDGAVLACDLQYLIRSERGFKGALISETAFPAFDAASKTSGYLTVRFATRSLLPVKDPGTKLTLNLGSGGKQKLWLTSNFRLQIDGLDCTKVSRIAPFAVRRPIELVSTGGTTDLRAGPIDFPSLRIAFPATSAGSWAAWYDDFVVKGSNGPAKERKGSLTLLAPNLVSELARVDFGGLGIFRLTTDRDEDAPPHQIATITADLYCEQMVLVAGGAP